MSIFPKRTLRDTTVTIHWNFNTSHLENEHVFPFVRIGVKDPEGKVTMLFEKHVLGLPKIDISTNKEENKLLYINKNTPLLVIAEYLSGQHKTEKLVEILENIQSGRHYYFTFDIREDAPLGKYTLVSEVHSNGHVHYSKTANDDFFFVEHISVDCFENGESITAEIINHSPEPVPLRIIGYNPGENLKADALQVFELGGHKTFDFTCYAEHTFVNYNEEREWIAVKLKKSPICIRNPEVIELTKPGKDIKTWLINKISNQPFTFNDNLRAIWRRADGLNTRDNIRNDSNCHLYDEMLSENLIKEVSN